MKRWDSLKEAILEGDTFSAIAEKKELSQDEALELAENAVKKGKYFFAARAYQKAYGEEWKDTVLDKYIKNGAKLLSSGDVKSAVKEFITAASLNEPVKLYQSRSLEFHKSCGSQACILQDSDFNNIADSIFKYFLNNEKIIEILGKQDIELKKDFLKLLIKEYEPELDDFLSRFSYALEILRKGTDQYISLREKLGDEEKIIKEIPKYEFSQDEVNELRETQINSEGEIELPVVKERVNSLLGKLRKFDDSSLLVELNNAFDGKGNYLPSLVTFQEAEVQSEYENSLKEEAESYERLLKESSERAILDILELAEEEHSNEISQSLFSRLIDFLHRLIELKSDLLINHLRYTYVYSQRVLLGRKTGADAYWQYLKELSVSHPISVFMVCIMPNAFLRHRSFSGDILMEIRDITESDKFVIPIIREDGKTMVEFLGAK